MDRFRVGQRVRYIHDGAVPTGTLGVIVYPRGHCQEFPEKYGVEMDGYPCPVPPGTHWRCQERWLEPVNDDGDFQRFMERVLKLLPEPITA